jgi:hypothetical protein
VDSIERRFGVSRAFGDSVELHTAQMRGKLPPQGRSLKEKRENASETPKTEYAED